MKEWRGKYIKWLKDTNFQKYEDREEASKDIIKELKELLDEQDEVIQVLRDCKLRMEQQLWFHYLCGERSKEGLTSF